MRARIWAASALAALAVLMAMLLIGAPPQGAGPAAAGLRLSRIDSFDRNLGVCRAALAAAGFATEALPDKREGGCGYRNAVELTQSVHAYSAPVATRCAMAAALALWERDVVAPAARRYFGQDVMRIELAGPSYACRPVAGTNRLSEHARANAMDIGGFLLADGRRISVERGWRGQRAERAFLRAVRDGACARFDAVLSPDYNRAHRDHLHFDRGPNQMCR